MDKIMYTGEATKEEVIQGLNILISKFLREQHDKEKNSYIEEFVMMLLLILIFLEMQWNSNLLQYKTS